MDTIVHFVQHFYFAHKSIIFMMVIGMVAGLLAQMILPGRGFGLLATMAIGMAGAWLGNTFIQPHLTFIEHSLFRGIASATIGAMALALAINIVRGGNERDKSHWRHN